MIAATTACKRPIADAGTSTEVVVAVDPADPQPVNIEFEAWWGDSARERARIEMGSLFVQIDEPPLPPGVVVRGIDLGTGESYEGRGDWYQSFPAACTEDGCEQAVEITFDVPSDAEPFDVLLEASGSAFLGDREDEDDLELRLDVFGEGIP